MTRIDAGIDAGAAAVRETRGADTKGSAASSFCRAFATGAITPVCPTLTTQAICVTGTDTIDAKLALRAYHGTGSAVVWVGLAVDTEAGAFQKARVTQACPRYCVADSTVRTRSAGARAAIVPARPAGTVGHAF